jgi:Tol biopolymer transport system component
MALPCLTLLASVFLAAATELAHASASVNQQMVFMTPTANGELAPGPNASYEIAVMNLDGSGFRQLTNDGKFKFLPHFSPDGTKILYTKFSVGGYSSPDAVTDIAEYDLATDKETMVTSGGNNGYGTWSPDGSRIAYLNAARLGSATGPTAIVTIAADGSSPQIVGAASGVADDWVWGDIAWSSDNWILFVVGETVDGAFCKSRVDKIRPDGSSRTQVSDGGTNCTPPGTEAVGDADPGWSSDGKVIYSSRGFPIPPANGPATATERKLYAFSSDSWVPGKVEQDLSLPSEPSCIEGVPKGSPDGKHVLLFRVCFDTGVPKAGIYLTDTSGSYRTFVAEGFGPDWNPVTSTSPPIAIGGYMSGNWFNPQQGGSGFQIEAATNNVMVAIWFVYSPDGSSQNWIYAQGTYDNTSSSVTLPAIVLTGAKFPPNYKLSDVIQTPWGNITFNFTDCNNGTATWSSALPGYGTGSMAIVRLTQIDGTACPQQQ